MMGYQFLRVLASLRLTVCLLAAAMVLIFVGTLAQVHMGVWQTVDAYFRSPVAWIDLQLFMPRQVATVPWVVPFPGGVLIGALMVVNLLAAHAVRFKLQRRRIGIILLHAGVIVLLAGEFVTGMLADEGMMAIDEGDSANFVEDIRTVELVLVDPSDAAVDRVVSISESLLHDAVQSGEPLSAGQPAAATMPFEIRIDKWLANSRLLRASGPTLADHGVGLEAVPEELPRVRGVDGAQADAPSAYVSLYRDGEKLGTWLLSSHLVDSQRVEVEGQPFGIALRFRRTYKPYTLHLIDFRHDKFVGTEIPRNFSSLVRIDDPSQGTDRQVLIRMNQPLRYRGATFYQSSYKPDGSGTVLQVVRNPGAALPYVACALVAVGMGVHFVTLLTGFLRRQGKQQDDAAQIAGQTVRPGIAALLLPSLAGCVGLLIAVSGVIHTEPSGAFDVQRFAALPVSSGGRVKPMDTAARHVLMVAGGRQSIRHEGQIINATTFLLDLMAHPEAIKQLPIVRVDHPDILALLDQPPEAVGRLPLSMIEPNWQTITEQAMSADEVPAKQRDPFQREIVSLFHRVSTILAHSSMMSPHTVPPLHDGEQWRTFHDAFLASSLARPELAQHDSLVHPGLVAYIDMMTAYSQDDAPAFNKAVDAYDTLLRQQMPDTMRRADLEVLFNRASLFTGTINVYVLAGLLLLVAMLLRVRQNEAENAKSTWAERLRRIAVGLLWAAFIVHTLAIVWRIYLQQRPPVTNLYSSAVMVGWAAVLIGLIVERYSRLGVAAVGAAVVGFVTLVIAHHLGSDGDTMQMMQAVLDSNFWLATHVIVITLGYSATFLAGALAAVFILIGVFTRWLTKPRVRMLGGMVYGVICFALLLSFIGTLLGGIWADQSWGRFWGWDPKENGAALIVLMCALILHARWCGMIRQRGIMVLAVGGNIVTAWSWFGTNMLGVGLHSYGFMDSAVFWLAVFVLSQVIIMAIGLIPTAGWRSPSFDSKVAT